MKYDLYVYQTVISERVDKLRMASLLRFTVNSIELQNAIQIKHDLAESSRYLHFIAARKIQVNHNLIEKVNTR